MSGAMECARGSGFADISLVAWRAWSFCLLAVAIQYMPVFSDNRSFRS